jgi:hypothetical protein
MTTSGVYTLTVSRDDIIREAMLNLGKLGDNESPSATETTDCARKLNMLCKQWMGKADFAPGLKMWTRKHGDLYLSSTKFQYNLGPTGDNWSNGSYQRQLTATASAGATALTVPNTTNLNSGDFLVIQLDSGDIFSTTAGTISGNSVPCGALPSQASANNWVFNFTSKAQRPEFIETCVLRDVNGNDTPVNMMTLQDYDFLPSKASPTYVSLPQAIYYEQSLGNGMLFIDVAGSSDVTQHLHMTYMEPMQIFQNPTDTPYYPETWYRALCWGLTKEISPMFNAPFTNDMKDNYLDALKTARELYAETTSMYFEPGNDYIAWSNSSR